MDKLRNSRIILQHTQNTRQILGIPFGSFFRLGNHVYQKPVEPIEKGKIFWCLTTGKLEEIPDTLTHVWPVDITVTEYEYEQPDDEI